MQEEIIRCSKCILPSTYPGIDFDERGICNFCRQYSDSGNNPALSRKDRLDEIIDRYKNKGKYDVIVGLSGGKDSSYVAYYLHKEYALKILGINFDNGYRSEYALRNLALLSDSLGIDVITVGPNFNFLKKLYAHFLRTRGEFCSVCNNMGYLLVASFCHREQKLNGFSPLAVGGWSKQYEFQPGVSVTSMQYFFENLTPSLCGELLAQPFIEEAVVNRYRTLHDPRQAKLETSGNKEKPVMDMIQLPDYISWNMREIPEILAKEIGWHRPADTHASHFDCTVFPIKEFLKYKKYGLSQETIKNSIMIREGIMTREEALAYSALEQKEKPNMYENFLHEVGLTAEEVNEEAEWSR
jgi:hypothetical protein